AVSGDRAAGLVEGGRGQLGEGSGMSAAGDFDWKTRTRALELAIETTRGTLPGSPTEVVERAKTYLKFLEGPQGKDGDEQAQQAQSQEAAQAALMAASGKLNLG